MDTSFSVKSVIVVEDIYVSLLLNSASGRGKRTEHGEGQGDKIRGTKERKEGKTSKLKLKV